MEEVPRLAKGARSARTKRTATTRDEHPGDQQADGLGPQDHSKVPTATKCAAGVRAAARTSQQARSVQALSGRTDACWSVERVRAVAGAARTKLQRWLHDSERLVTTGAAGHGNRGCTTIRNPTW